MAVWSGLQLLTPSSAFVSTVELYQGQSWQYPVLVRLELLIPWGVNHNVSSCLLVTRVHAL